MTNSEVVDKIMKTMQSSAPITTASAETPAITVDGVLRVPEDVRHVGWWDGSARAGEAFGSTVIAGHVDSDTDGIGFFARLLKVKVGDTITLWGQSHRLKYRVTSVRKVPKKALATDSRAPRQTGPHRLVLITWTGISTGTGAGMTAILWWLPNHYGWLASRYARAALLGEDHVTIWSPYPAQQVRHCGAAAGCGFSRYAAVG